MLNANANCLHPQKSDQLQSEVKVLQTAEGALKREKTFLEERVSQLDFELQSAKLEASEAQTKLASSVNNMTGISVPISNHYTICILSLSAILYVFIFICELCSNFSICEPSCIGCL